MPNAVICPTKYAKNIAHLHGVMKRNGISVMAVTKVFRADQQLIDVINQSEIEFVADSRIDNLKTIKTDKPKVLLRMPTMAEAKETVQYADISLNSELATIKALDQAAKALNQTHRIILMFDLGDLREGIYYQDDYMPIVSEILKLEHITIEGIGTNLTCFGGVIPTPETLEKLLVIKTDIEITHHIEIHLVSGGNSSSYKLVSEGRQPKGINNLRIGEALILGRETAYGNPIPGMHDDVITLEAEVIECKDKPSMPEGELGMDAFGNKVHFTDYGIMRRAILSVGRQDVACEDLIPPEGVEVLGCSSDHLIVRLHNQDVQIGDTITFKLTYGGILRVMTSPYVRKCYRD